MPSHFFNFFNSVGTRRNTHQNSSHAVSKREKKGNQQSKGTAPKDIITLPNLPSQYHTNTLIYFLFTRVSAATSWLRATRASFPWKKDGRRKSKKRSVAAGWLAGCVSSLRCVVLCFFVRRLSNLSVSMDDCASMVVLIGFFSAFSLL